MRKRRRVSKKRDKRIKRTKKNKNTNRKRRSRKYRGRKLVQHGGGWWVQGPVREGETADQGKYEAALISARDLVLENAQEGQTIEILSPAATDADGQPQLVKATFLGQKEFGIKIRITEAAAGYEVDEEVDFDEGDLKGLLCAGGKITGSTA
jgi:hypothetical protein